MTSPFPHRIPSGGLGGQSRKNAVSRGSSRGLPRAGAGAGPLGGRKGPHWAGGGDPSPPGAAGPPAVTHYLDSLSLTRSQTNQGSLLLQITMDIRQAYHPRNGEVGPLKKETQTLGGSLSGQQTSVTHLFRLPSPGQAVLCPDKQEWTWARCHSW